MTETIAVVIGGTPTDACPRWLAGDRAPVDHRGSAGRDPPIRRPFDRDPVLVREDVLDGSVSVEAARWAYGLATTEEMDVDWSETAAIREGGEPDQGWWA